MDRFGARFGLLLLLASPLRSLVSDASAQQPAAPIAYVPTTGVTVTGSLSVVNGEAVIGSDGAVTAGDRTANIRLARGGLVRLCATTTVHMSSDRTISDVQSSALMMSLDRGALEASYSTGKYSDVLMTPDFRILISGPGEADLKLRVNAKGDTCLDNHGAGAPYVTVTSLLDGGLYRVQPNQRVQFEHGDIKEVVDNEQEPCGCPPAAPVLEADNTASSQGEASGKPVGGPSSTPADTAFPLAESEGLAPPPAPPTSPIVAPGQTHAQVTVPLVYDSAAPPPPPPPTGAATGNAIPAPAAATGSETKKHAGFLTKIGHFFSRIFGG